MGITHWVAVMEPTLLRLLRRSGIAFNLLGDPVEYHGLRQPCYAKIGDLLAGVYAKNREIWDLFTDSGRLWRPPGI